jgi:uncharacterized membrane protein
MSDIYNENREVKLPSIWFIITILIISIVGIADTTYLTIKRYSQDSINCSIFEGCDFVTTSTYSTILGVPVAVLGIIFYTTVFVLSILYLRSKNKKFLISLLGLSGVGFLMSLWFIYTQAFILNAFCLYCLVSAGLSTTIFILSAIIVLKYRKGVSIINKP